MLRTLPLRFQWGRCRWCKDNIRRRVQDRIHSRILLHYGPIRLTFPIVFFLPFLLLWLDFSDDFNLSSLSARQSDVMCPVLWQLFHVIVFSIYSTLLPNSFCFFSTYFFFEFGFLFLLTEFFESLFDGFSVLNRREIFETSAFALAGENAGFNEFLALKSLVNVSYAV